MCDVLLSVALLWYTGCFKKNGTQWFSCKIVTSEAISLKFAECDTDKWEQVHCKSCWARIKITETTEC